MLVVAINIAVSAVLLVMFVRALSHRMRFKALRWLSSRRTLSFFF